MTGKKCWKKKKSLAAHTSETINYQRARFERQENDQAHLVRHLEKLFSPRFSCVLLDSCHRMFCFGPHFPVLHVWSTSGLHWAKKVTRVRKKETNDDRMLEQFCSFCPNRRVCLQSHTDIEVADLVFDYDFWSKTDYYYSLIRFSCGEAYSSCSQLVYRFSVRSKLHNLLKYRVSSISLRKTNNVWL